MRVLFVDDETQVLQGLRRLLFSRRNRWQLSFSADGSEALALLAAEHFDVVISDVRMPRMNGIDLLAQARQAHPHLVRVLLSGQVDPEGALRAPEVAHRFLSKPCDAEELVAMLEQIEELTALPATLLRLVTGVTSLPSVPALRRALRERLADSTATADDAAAIIQRDVAMSAKALHLVSSSFLGLARPELDVAGAVRHIGLDRLRRLLAVPDVFDGPVPGSAADALLDGLMSADAETAAAGTAALLCDVGQLALAAREGDRYSAAVAVYATSGEPLHAVELREHGFTHADVGAALLMLWGLPADVVHAVRHHHGDHAPRPVPSAPPPAAADPCLPLPALEGVT